MTTPEGSKKAQTSFLSQLVFNDGGRSLLIRLSCLIFKWPRCMGSYVRWVRPSGKDKGRRRNFKVLSLSRISVQTFSAATCKRGPRSNFLFYLFQKIGFRPPQKKYHYFPEMALLIKLLRFPALMHCVISYEKSENKNIFASHSPEGVKRHKFSHILKWHPTFFYFFNTWMWEIVENCIT